MMSVRYMHSRRRAAVSTFVTLFSPSAVWSFPLFQNKAKKLPLCVTFSTDNIEECRKIFWTLSRRHLLAVSLAASPDSSNTLTSYTSLASPFHSLRPLSDATLFDTPLSLSISSSFLAITAKDRVVVQQSTISSSDHHHHLRFIAPLHRLVVSF